MFARDAIGQSDGVQFSDIAALPVQVGAAIRSRRLFHPVGVLAAGAFQRLAPEGDGLPMESGEVIGRVSKGVGLPGTFADIAGLAWRMPQPSAPTPWDVLLASTVRGRLLLAPVTAWSNTTFSSLMPFRYQDGVWWVRARLATPIGARGLALGTIKERIVSGGIEFDVEQAAGTGGFLRLGRLTLNSLHTGEDVAFDPILNIDPGVHPLPQWLTSFRRAAYRRSRQGRDAD